MTIYARERVPHVWLLDPLARTLEVFRLEGDRWIVAGAYSGSSRVRAEPFDATELDMEEWWLPETEPAP